MTILGKHTVAETQALGDAVQYQFNQVEAAFNSIAHEWKGENPERYAKLVSDWSKAKLEWNKAWSEVKTSLIFHRAAAPAVKDALIPSESDYIKVRSHTAAGGRNGDDSLYMTDRYVATINGKKIDYSKQPSQLDIHDPDFDALKDVDGAIKKGENAAKGAATSNTTLYVGLGAAGALGLVLLAKVYL